MYLFFVLCFFPYISILPLQTDAQPNALIMAFIIFVSVFYCQPKIKLPIDFWVYGVIFICAVFLSIKSFNFNTIRSLINYLSIFIISPVTYILLKKYKFPYKLLNISIKIWFIVGFIQTFIYSHFLTFLSFRAMATGSHGRGVTALAPEPTFYALIAGLLLLLCLLNRQREQLNKFNIVLCLISIFAFSKSTTVTLLIIAAFLFYLIIFILCKDIKYFFYLFLVIIILIILLYIIINVDINNRLFNIIRKGIHDPQYLIKGDGSINDRFIHVFFSIKGFFENYMFPKGFNEFNNYMQDIYLSQEYSEYLVFYRDNYTRILSGYGSVFFELGILGVYIFISINMQFLKTVKHRFSNMFSLIFFNFMLFMALPFVTALIPFIIGNIYYLNYKCNDSKS
ncbi:MAG: hypothetical protein LBE13_14225 [Bacteroidales bacterium]|jgi:hypothetical protein|nr:hypothetical protein [Bacteroidales bacterium]